MDQIVTAGISVVVLLSIVVVAQGGPVNTDEPTQWCSTCSFHDTASSNEKYWGYFPNGDHPRFGLFRLGHRWQAGTYNPAWNTDFSWTHVAFFQDTPIKISLDQWVTTNSYIPIVPHLSEMWSAICPLDSDGDGFTNGVELGDPNCAFPGTAARTTDLSDPNDPASVPTTTTTSTTTTTTTSTTTTPASTTSTSSPTDTLSSPTTTTADYQLTSNMLTSMMPPTSTVNASAMAVPCHSWMKYAIVADGNETTFTSAACVGSGGGDPHYQRVDGVIATCDNLGWSTLIESSEVLVTVRHDALGSTTATTIGMVRYQWKASSRMVDFASTPNASTTSDSDLIANSNGVTDYNGRNYVEVQRILTNFGMLLNVQTVFAEPTGGILVHGCPEGSPVYDSRKVTESPVCADIVDNFARYACNADVQRTGSDELVPMAKGAEALRNQVIPIGMPTNGTAPVTRRIDSKPPGGLEAVAYWFIGGVVLFALAMIAAFVAVIVWGRRRDKIEAAEKAAAERRAAQAAHAMNYAVGRESIPSVDPNDA